ncbi:MAG: EAL domain-containing protein [Lachnospiraceae bacterium]|nr:EAL domain-containing protein [Lachnospiraceae bacterium]
MSQKWRKWLGFQPYDEYQKEYYIRTNLQSGIYLCIIVSVLEIWMLYNVFKNMITHEIARTTRWYVSHISSYCVLLFMALIMLWYAISYLRGKSLSRRVGSFLICTFSLICVLFGMYISRMDFSKGEQVLSFLTMMIFVGCLFAWRPWISLLINGISFLAFYYIMADVGNISYALKINYFIIFISIFSVSINTYEQRRMNVEIDESLEASNIRLRELALKDELTGLYNMNYFYQEADKTIADESISIPDMIFLFFDVVNFKAYNEQYGFIKGNEFLKHVAELLNDTFPKDIVSRFSDDHFMVLSTHPDVEAKVSDIIEKISNDGEDVYIGIKVGAYKPVDRDCNSKIACDHARYACSQNRQAYNETYKIYDDKMRRTYHLKQYIINNIDNAVKEGYLRVYYQPIVDANTREVCELEALLRWIDPKYGFLSPGDFIPTLEEFRQIHKADMAVIDIVCRDIREVLDSGLRPIPVSLNFSRLDFELTNITNYLTMQESKYDIPSEYIHIEITESAIIEDFAELKSAMNSLRTASHEIWLDDFGSGYSSLNILKDYKFDVLKIDMKFLEHIENSEAGHTILKSIIDMANALSIVTLTEGVENDNHAIFLRDIGCKYLQGYLFGKPAPIEDFKEAVKSGKYHLKKTA